MVKLFRAFFCITGLFFTTSAHADETWIQVAAPSDGLSVFEAKKGSFERNVTQGSSDPVVAMILRNRSLGGAGITFEKVYVRVRDCRVGSGKLVTTTLDGSAKYENEFVSGGGNVASTIADTLCALERQSSLDPAKGDLNTPKTRPRSAKETLEFARRLDFPESVKFLKGPDGKELQRIFAVARRVETPKFLMNPERAALIEETQVGWQEGPASFVIALTNDSRFPLNGITMEFWQGSCEEKNERATHFKISFPQSLRPGGTKIVAYTRETIGSDKTRWCNNVVDAW